MSKKNRDRRIANREARVEWEAVARRRAKRMRWGIPAALLAVAAAVGLFVLLDGDDDGGDDAAATSTTTAAGATTTTVAGAPVTTATTAAPASAAGKPCVEVSGELPEGAPAVPVQAGPPPTELVVEDLTVGDGEEVPAGATVTVDYIGVACSTGAVFDASYGRGEPATFSLDGVIPGWTEGIPGMKVGGTRLLGIPSEMAYGATGSPPAIAPDEALWFVVELRAIA